jgi:hypothetical protein
MNCGLCLAENQGNNAFCGQCGAPLADDSVPRYPDQKKAARREIGIVIVGVVFVLAAAMGSYLAFYQTRSPETIVRKFIEADQKGDFAGESLYVSSGLDSRLIMSLVQGVRAQTGTSPFQQYKIIGSSVNNDRASVHVQITVNPPPAPPSVAAPVPPVPTKYDIYFFLIRENSDWKIDPAETAAGLTGVLLAAGLQQSPLNLLFNGNPGAGTFPFPWPNGTMPNVPGLPTTPPSVPQNNPGSGFL